MVLTKICCLCVLCNEMDSEVEGIIYLLIIATGHTAN